MAFNVGKTTTMLYLKKKISIGISGIFIFKIWRMKIGNRYSKHLILIGCPWAYKAWWI